MKVCSSLIDFGQIAKVLKRDRLGGETSLTYCRCLGIEMHSQKSGVKSKELVVEWSLKLGALNLNWLWVIDGPPLLGQFRKEYP